MDNYFIDNNIHKSIEIEDVSENSTSNSNQKKKSLNTSILEGATSESAQIITC